MLKVAFFITARKHVDNINKISPVFSKEVHISIYTDRKDFHEITEYENIFLTRPDIIVLWMAYPKLSVLNILKFCLEKKIPCIGIQEVHQMGLNRNRVNHYFTPLDALIVASEDEKIRLIKHNIYSNNICIGGWPFIERIYRKKKLSLELKTAVLFLSPLQVIDSTSIETKELRSFLIKKTVNMLPEGWDLLIKLHPMENSLSLNLDELYLNKIHVKVVSNSVSSEELIINSSVCFNYGNSQVCIEILALGKPLYVLDQNNEYLPVIPLLNINTIEEYLEWYSQKCQLDKINLFLDKNLIERRTGLYIIASFIEEYSFTRDVKRFAIHLSLFFIYIGEHNISENIINKFICDNNERDYILDFFSLPSSKKLINLLDRYKTDKQLVWLLSSIYRNKSIFNYGGNDIPPKNYIPFFWRAKNSNYLIKTMTSNKIRKIYRILRKSISLKKVVTSYSLEPVFLVLPVTYRCNLSCVMCTCPTQAKTVGELSIINIEKSLKNITFNGRNRLHKINLTGGELFLRKDLEEIVNLLVNYGTTEIGISSNCYSTQLTIDGFESLLKKYSDIKWGFQTSLDGDEITHNIVRRNSNAFKNTVATLEELRLLKNKYEFNLSVNATVSPENIDSIIKIEPYINMLGISMNYTYAVDSDMFINSRNSDVSSKLKTNDYFDKLKIFSSDSYKKNLDIFSLDIYLMLHGHNRFTPCAFYGGGYFIEPTGKLFKCSVTEESYLFDSIEKKMIDNISIQHIVDSISDTCNTCFNNCGNSLYGRGFSDFYKSDFISTRNNIYLDTISIDVVTHLNLIRLGIKAIPYRGQEVFDNDLILYTLYSKNNLQNKPLISAIRIPFGAI